MAEILVPRHVDNTMGAAYIGVVAAAVLYGGTPSVLPNPTTFSILAVSFVQAWYYFMKYSQDVWYIKALVGSIWFFETVHQALISHTVYYYIVTNYNNSGTLDTIVWSILLEVLFNGLIGLLVQGFLALRVWRLSGSNVPLTALVGCLVLAGFGCSVAFTAQSMRLHTWAELESLKRLSEAVNVVGAITDVLITAALFVYLRSSKTGFKKSDTMISKLIVFTVSTGLLTSVCAVASLISILASGHTLIYVAFYFSLGRLYSNSVLVTLNARQTIRNLGENSDELSFSLQTMSKTDQRNLNSARSTNISIKIDTIQDFLRDQHLENDNSLEAGSPVSLAKPF